MKLAYFEFEKTQVLISNLFIPLTKPAISKIQIVVPFTLFTLVLFSHYLGHHKTGRSSSQQNPEAQSCYKCVTKRLALRMILCEVPVICQATQAKHCQQLI